MGRKGLNKEVIINAVVDIIEANGYENFSIIMSYDEKAYTKNRKRRL